MTKKRNTVTKRAPENSPVHQAHALVGKGMVAFDLAPSPLKLPIPFEVALRAGTEAWVLPGVSAVAKAAPRFEGGAVLDDMRELFLTKDSEAGAGILLLRRKDDGNWNALVSKGTLPYVLSREALDKNVMPPPGESWLPASLMAAVPKRMRYWDMQGEAALAARADLVGSGLFGEDLIKLVDGELRLCTIRHFLYTPDEEVAPEIPSMAKSLPSLFSRLAPDTVFAQGAVGADDFLPAVASLAKSDAVVFLTADDAAGASAIAGTLLGARPSSAWLAVAPDSPAARASLATVGKLFKIPGGDDTVLVASFAPPPGALVEWIAAEKDDASSGGLAANGGALAPQQDDKKKPKTVKFLKAGDDASAPAADERYILGIVLEPEVVDAQNDVYDAATIRAAAHGYMEKFATMKLMHAGEPIDDKVKILESYIAPVDFKVGDQVVKAGTWLMACKIVDDGLWSAAKKGELTGFSIGGSAMRAPANAG